MGNLWTPAEDAIMRDYYPRHGARWEGWVLLLPGRSRSSIYGRAQHLGLRYAGPCKSHPDWMEKSNERAAAAVAALSDWQRTRLALLMQTAGVREES